MTRHLAHPLLALALLLPGCDRIQALIDGDTPASGSADASASEGEKKWDPSSSDPPPAAEPPHGSWIAFESQEGRFKAQFPRSPQTETSQTPTAVGNLDMITYSAQNGEVYYAVATADYPADMVKASDPAKILDGARDGAAANVNGKLTSEKQIDVNGHKGRRINITASMQGIDLVLDAVLILVENRLFQAIVVHPTTQSVDADIEHFLTSFAPA